MARSSTGSATRRWATSPSRAIPTTRSRASARSTAIASKGWPAARPSRHGTVGRAEHLEGAERKAAAELVGSYVGAGIRSIVYALAPERIVIGGGLSALPGLAAAARAELDRELAGYPALPEHGQPDFISLALLGGQAGPVGTLILAERALARPVLGS